MKDKGEREREPRERKERAEEGNYIVRDWIACFSFLQNFEEGIHQSSMTSLID